MPARPLLILIAFLFGGAALYLSREGIDAFVLGLAALSGLAFLGASLGRRRS